MPLAFSAGDVAYVALSIFLLAVGLGLGWMFIRTAATLDRLSSFIQGTERDLLPVITKLGGSVDRMNYQLDKLDQATDSAVDAVDAVDEGLRALSFAVKRPVQKLTGLSAGASHGWASLRARRNWRDAVSVAKEAAVRREADLDEELRRPRD